MVPMSRFIVTFVARRQSPATVLAMAEWGCLLRLEMEALPSKFRLAMTV
jgi:hypothetical protein